MNRQEHLLTIMAEECAEVAQRISKALRFGLSEVEPGQDATNAERIVWEFMDLRAAFEMLKDEGAFPLEWTDVDSAASIARKRAKVEKFLRYSETCGTLAQMAAKGEK